MRISLPFSRVAMGLDIQEDAVRLVKMVQTSRGVLRGEAWAVSLQHTVFNGNIIEDWEGVRAALTELVIVNQLRPAKVVVSLPASLIVFGSSELAAEIDLDTWQIDHVSFVATKRDYVVRYVEELRLCGLHVTVIDVDIYALQRLVVYALSHRPHIKTKTLALVYIQKSTCHYIVWQSDQLLWHKTFKTENVCWQTTIRYEYELSQLAIDEYIFLVSENEYAAIENETWPCPIHFIRPLTTCITNVAELTPFSLAAGLALRGLKNAIN